MNSLIFTRILDSRYEVDQFADNDDMTVNINSFCKNIEEDFVLVFDENKWELSYRGPGTCVDKEGVVSLKRGRLENQVWEKLEIDHAIEEVNQFFEVLFDFPEKEGIEIKDDVVTVFNCDGDVIIEFDLYNMELVDYRENYLYDGPVYFDLGLKDSF